MEKNLIRTHRRLDAYPMAYQAAMNIFHESRSFAIEERYSLNDQIRRPARSVCTNLAETCRKRRYLEEMIGVNL